MLRWLILTALSKKSSLDRHCAVYFRISLNFIKHRLPIKILFLQRNGWVGIIRKIWVFIFMETYELVACYHIVFYNGHSLDNILHIYRGFNATWYKMRRTFHCIKNSTIIWNYCKKNVQMDDYFSIHIIYYDSNVLCTPNVLLY